MFTLFFNIVIDVCDIFSCYCCYLCCLLTLLCYSHCFLTLSLLFATCIAFLLLCWPCCSCCFIEVSLLLFLGYCCYCYYFCHIAFCVALLVVPFLSHCHSFHVTRFALSLLSHCCFCNVILLALPLFSYCSSCTIASLALPFSDCHSSCISSHFFHVTFFTLLLFSHFTYLLAQLLLIFLRCRCYSFHIVVALFCLVSMVFPFPLPCASWNFDTNLSTRGELFSIFSKFFEFFFVLSF